MKRCESDFDEIYSSVIPGAGSEYIYRSGGYQQCIAQTVKGGHAFCIESVDRMLDYTGNVEEQLMDLSDLTNDNNSRYTLIRMDGTVVADTEVTQVNQMENHLERKGSEGCAGDGLWIFGASFRNVRNCRWRTRRSVHRTANTYGVFLPVQLVWGEYILMLIPAAFEL